MTDCETLLFFPANNLDDNQGIVSTIAKFYNCPTYHLTPFDIRTYYEDYIRQESIHEEQLTYTKFINSHTSVNQYMVNMFSHIAEYTNSIEARNRALASALDFETESQVILHRCSASTDEQHSDSDSDSESDSAMELVSDDDHETTTTVTYVEENTPPFTLPTTSTPIMRRQSAENFETSPTTEEEFYDDDVHSIRSNGASSYDPVSDATLTPVRASHRQTITVPPPPPVPSLSAPTYYLPATSNTPVRTPPRQTNPIAAPPIIRRVTRSLTSPLSLSIQTQELDSDNDSGYGYPESRYDYHMNL